MDQSNIYILTNGQRLPLTQPTWQTTYQRVPNYIIYVNDRTTDYPYQRDNDAVREKYDPTAVVVRM